MFISLVLLFAVIARAEQNVTDDFKGMRAGYLDIPEIKSVEATAQYGIDISSAASTSATSVGNVNLTTRLLNYISTFISA